MDGVTADSFYALDTTEGGRFAYYNSNENYAYT